MTEYQIQSYLWEQRENWKSLIAMTSFSNKYNFDDKIESIYSLSPHAIIYNQILTRLEETYNYCLDIMLFGCEVPLKKEGDSTIRADLLGVSNGRAGIAIIELKKSAQTERQAFTELLAYASHLKFLFPMMSKEDITYVLISPMEERIVREATIHSLFFDENPVFAFIPKWEGDDINTLKLHPWIPELREVINIFESAFSQKNFDVFKVCWDKIDDWNADEHENPEPYMIERMNKIASYTAQIMESKGVHGFVFCSHSFPELPFLQNAIIVAGINPFKVSKDYYLIREGFSASELQKIPDEQVNLLNLMPGLANKAKELNEKNDFFYSLTMSWGNTLCKIAFESVNTMTSNSKGLRFEKGWGGMNWKQYLRLDFEDSYCFNYDVFSTGALRKLIVDYSLADYQYILKFGYENHPILYHGNFPEFMVDYFLEQYHFREFLLRLVDPFWEYKHLLGEDSEE